jgi:hypothetical protein
LALPPIYEKLAELTQLYPHAGSFCFFTDTANLPTILREGCLFSRDEASRRGLIKLDCASTRVLAGTPTWVHKCVRLYFAPLTPMLYRIEGIKRTADDWPECPRPFYLVFDHEVLAAPRAIVSSGNMASRGRPCRPATDDGFFNTLPFADIFYRGPVLKDPEAQALFGYDARATERLARRQAELLIPERLPLAGLRRLVFRSDAERDLALADSGGPPQGVQISVDKSWFFAQQLQRPHIESFQQGPGGSFAVTNAAVGDTFTQLRTHPDGRLETHQTTFNGEAWGPWTPNNSVPGLAAPPPGRMRYFLRTHRVAEEDAY